MFFHTAEAVTTGKHLSGLALGRFTSSTFSRKTVDDLRSNLLRVLSESGERERDADRLPACPQPSLCSW